MPRTPVYGWPYLNRSTDPLTYEAVSGEDFLLAVEDTVSALAARVSTLETDITALKAAWTPWVPALTNLTLGNGMVTARSRTVGKTWDYRFKFVLGSTSAVGTNPRFSIPVTAHASYSTVSDTVGDGTLLDFGTANRLCVGRLAVGAQAIDLFDVGSTGLHATITATAPWTWTTGDALMVSGTIELA